METSRIAAVPIFDGLPEDEVAAVAEAASVVEVEAGQPLATEGEFGHALFVIERGTAEVVRDGVVLASVGPGDVVGEIAVLASGRRTASVVATSPMCLLALFKRDVWRLEQRAPAAAQRLREVLDGHRNGAESAATHE